jgi:hypothetical protein
MPESGSLYIPLASASLGRYFFRSVVVARDFLTWLRQLNDLFIVSRLRQSRLALEELAMSAAVAPLPIIRLYSGTLVY